MCNNVCAVYESMYKFAVMDPCRIMICRYSLATHNVNLLSPYILEYGVHPLFVSINCFASDFTISAGLEIHCIIKLLILTIVSLLYYMYW